MAIVTRPSQSVVTGCGDDTLPSWQQSMRVAVRDPLELCRRLRLPAEYEPAAQQAAELFGVFVPEEYLRRIRPGDAHDPLLRQVLPLAEEQATVAGFSTDPVGDSDAIAAPGLLHKYRSRALLVTTGACAVHCRYCFRRQFPYDQVLHGLDDWQPALDQIAADASIDEVILSGGDPLTVVDNRLAKLAGRIEQIPHVQRLRIHTRLPVMIPSRVNDSLLSWLTNHRLTPIVVVHVNHVAEIDTAVADAFARLVDAGVVVLNQSVLLRGVNDCVEQLVQLSRRLVDLRVMPYYLHQLDRVSGAAHFEVPIDEGVALVEQLRDRLPGYAVPRYVQERAGEPSKTVLE